MDGIRRSNYDVNKFQPTFPNGGLFSNKLELDLAYRSACSISIRLKMSIQKGKKYTREELEKEIDLESAVSAYDGAIGAIHIYMASGKNVTKYVMEAREALEILRRHEYVALNFMEKSFKELIGEI
jgi:hypothetical protein